MSNLKRYTGADWERVGTSPFVVIQKNVSNNNDALFPFSEIYANTSGGAFTLILPASPMVGDHIIIHDATNTFVTYNLTLNRNGNLINGVADNLECDINGTTINLRYKGSTIGWECVVESISGVVVNNTESEWTEYIPTVYASTTNPTIGNGTIRGKYKYLDSKTVIIHIHFVFGSTSSAGDGSYSISLPVGMTGIDIPQILTGEILDNGTDWKIITGRVDPSGNKIIEMVYDGGNTVSNASPMVWATGDVIMLSGIIGVI